MSTPAVTGFRARSGEEIERHRAPSHPGAAGDRSGEQPAGCGAGRVADQRRPQRLRQGAAAGRHRVPEDTARVHGGVGAHLGHRLGTDQGDVQEVAGPPFRGEPHPLPRVPAAGTKCSATDRDTSGLNGTVRPTRVRGRPARRRSRRGPGLGGPRHTRSAGRCGPRPVEGQPSSSARRSMSRPSCQVPSALRSYCRMMPTGRKPTFA